MTMTTAAAKRYWLFLFDAYYPDGGMNDFRGSFDTIEAAQEEDSRLRGEHRSERYDRGHIMDVDTCRVVAVRDSGHTKDYVWVTTDFPTPVPNDSQGEPTNYEYLIRE